VVEDLAAVDVALLPGAGDVRFDCSCPDWSDPCRHSAAVCYLLATELDRDPFVLFLLRGMHRAELMERVRSRRAAVAEQGDGNDRTDAASADAVEAWGRLPLDHPLQPPPELLRRHGFRRTAASRHPGWDIDIPPEHGIDLWALGELALEATQRALAMLSDATPSGLTAVARADLARRAATCADAAQLRELAGRAGVTVDRLEEWATTWAEGGDAAFERPGTTAEKTTPGGTP
jgi:hypothetical protein